MNQNKPRIIKDFEKLDPHVQALIRETYPNGYGSALITITNKDGMLISALPFETDDKYYLVKMPVKEAKFVEDEDFEEDVFAKETVKPDMDDEFKEEFGAGDDTGDDDDNYDDEDVDDDADDDVADDEDIEEDEED
ncbi:MAG: hypothetical protein QM786_11940 [Breznakibacter sp.]